jgi:hypothetical protein
MLVSYIRRRLTKSTLLRGVRSRPTCRNAAPHSGECEIHGKDGVAGSIPAGGSTPNQQARPGGRRPVVCQRFASRLLIVVARTRSGDDRLEKFAVWSTTMAERCRRQFAAPPSTSRS